MPFVNFRFKSILGEGFVAPFKISKFVDHFEDGNVLVIGNSAPLETDENGELLGQLVEPGAYTVTVDEIPYSITLPDDENTYEFTDLITA